MTDARTTVIKCQWCGFMHAGATCARLKSIEYDRDGVTVRRVEFHPPQPPHVEPHNVGRYPKVEIT